jgi:hypothetical protein
MQYNCPSPNVPSLKWGRDNENLARKEYRVFMEQGHVDFSLTIPSLCLHTDYRYIGATPDVLVSCNCCGDGLLEIKCPFRYKDVNHTTITDDSFYL